MNIAGFEVTNVYRDSAKVGCTTVTKAEVKALLAAMNDAPKRKVSIRVGDRVKCVRIVGDSAPVLNRVGTVVCVNELDDPIVRFDDWTDGWSWSSLSRDCWGVDASALEKLPKAAKRKRAR